MAVVWNSDALLACMMSHEWCQRTAARYDMFHVFGPTNSCSCACMLTGGSSAQVFLLGRSFFCGQASWPMTNYYARQVSRTEAFA